MAKIMLVLDSPQDQNFLEQILPRMGFDVISMRQGVDLSEQLIDHFPDVVFASTLGQNPRVLSALGKIKQMRGKPKLVFVRKERDQTVFTEDQKKIIDGILSIPVDILRLVEILSKVTGVPVSSLKEDLNKTLKTGEMGSGRARGAKGIGHHLQDDDLYVVNGDAGQRDEEKISVTSQKNSGPLGEPLSNEGGSESESQWRMKPTDKSEPIELKFDRSPAKSSASEQPSSLISNDQIKAKYQKIEAELAAKYEGVEIQQMDVGQLREMQKQQAEEISEGPEVRKNREHFLKTLFSMPKKGA